MKNYGWIWVAACVAALGAVLYGQFGGGCSEADAIDAIKKAAANELKSPSTASFPEALSVSRVGDCYFKIGGEMDGQNGFGAIRRSSFHGHVSDEEMAVKSLLVIQR